MLRSNAEVRGVELGPEVELELSELEAWLSGSLISGIALLSQREEYKFKSIGLILSYANEEKSRIYIGNRKSTKRGSTWALQAHEYDKTLAARPCRCRRHRGIAGSAIAPSYGIQELAYWIKHDKTRDGNGAKAILGNRDESL